MNLKKKRVEEMGERYRLLLKLLLAKGQKPRQTQFLQTQQTNGRQRDRDGDPNPESAA